MNKIVVLGGDGVGPEVTAAAVRVLEAASSQFKLGLEFENALIGGAAYDAAGSPLPPATVAACKASTAILLGAVGGPKWDTIEVSKRPEQGLLGIRKALGLFANLRPVTAVPELAAASPLKPEKLRGVDILVIRELTGGIYFGKRNRTATAAFDTCEYSAGEIERVCRVAAKLAMGRRKKITSVDKANVLDTSRLWRDVATRVFRDEFPELEVEHLLVDAAAMHLLSRPADFDVMVTENMYRLYATIQNAGIKRVPLLADKDFALDADAVLKAIDAPGNDSTGSLAATVITRLPEAGEPDR